MVNLSFVTSHATETETVNHLFGEKGPSPKKEKKIMNKKTEKKVTEENQVEHRVK